MFIGSPLELPNGRLVCEDHGLTTCHWCHLSFDFGSDVELTEEEGDDEPAENSEEVVEKLRQLFSRSGIDFLAEEQHKPDDPTTRLSKTDTRRVFPIKFSPQKGGTPQSLFPLRTLKGTSLRRFFKKSQTGNKQFLVYTDGACLNNGAANPRAGCSVVFNDREHLSFRLERNGPLRDGPRLQTSNRAELRAVIAAIRHRDWRKDGCDCLVIASDSVYVVEGTTTWAKKWIKNDWRTGTGRPVKNRDLWQTLFKELEMSQSDGLRIQFWRIPREWNALADGFAKTAADGPISTWFCD
jgi:ribonuclease HI